MRSSLDRISPALRTSPPPHAPVLNQVITAPAVFHWRGSGKKVSVAFGDDNFQKLVPLARTGSGADFVAYAELPNGKHHYRFLVDGVWKAASDLPVDIFVGDGSFANVMALDSEHTLEKDLLSSSPPGQYGHVMPRGDVAATAGEPPILPPHLQLALLNSPPLSVESTELPIPQTVTVNHFYSTVKGDSVLLFGLSHRYRQKFVTTVFYRPLHTSRPVVAAAAVAGPAGLAAGLAASTVAAAAISSSTAFASAATAAAAGGGVVSVPSSVSSVPSAAAAAPVSNESLPSPRTPAASRIAVAPDAAAAAKAMAAVAVMSRSVAGPRDPLSGVVSAPSTLMPEKSDRQ